jgi:hypothetical protein
MRITLLRGFVRSVVLLVAVGCPTSLVIAQPAGTFTPTGSMTTGRVSHTATLLDDGRVLIAGGAIFSDGKWSASRDAELYDPFRGTFAITGNMTSTRLYQTATLLPDGKVLIAGGMDGQSNPLATAEVYDPHSGTFTATGNMTVARGAAEPLSVSGPSFPNGPTAIRLLNGKVLIAGGYDRDSHPLATAELYDPSTGTFTATGEMVAPRRAPTATLLADGRVLVADGYNSVELYDPSSGTFTATGRMTFRLYHSATLLPDGKVLIAGGLDGESDPLWTAELYDPQTGTFTATGDMTTASMLVFINCGGPGCLLQQGRALHTSTLLADGSVLIAGGWPNYGPEHHGLASAEFYDRRAGTFRATGDMATGRCLHTATLLSDGTVLITGGIENYLSVSIIPGVSQTPLLPRVLDSAELYHPAVLAPPPALLSLSGEERGQGAIQHADTYQLVSQSNPAVEGDALIIYCTGLADGSVIPPQAAIGGRMAEVLWFGKTPVFAGLNQVNVKVPSGIAQGPAVPVRLNYIGRSSNEVTIAVR